MSQINTIPDKIPRRILRGLRKEKYDNLILFTLGVYGSHRLDELINDPNKSIENRMEEKLFYKWAEELKNNNLIEEYKKDNNKYYKITSKGKDELLSQIENSPPLSRLVERLISTFDSILGGTVSEKKIESKSISGDTISYRDYIFSLLSMDWRLESFFEAGQLAGELNPTDNMSFGYFFDSNAEKYANKQALLYNDLKFTFKELNELINRYANFFLSLNLKKGDVINVLLENRPELVIMIGVMSKIGTIASLINTRQRSASLIHSLKLNNAKIYVIGEELYDIFEKVKDDLDLTNEDQLYFLRDNSNNVIPEGYIDLDEKIRTQDVTTPSVMEDIKGTDPYAYIFTSGTTGLPKAAPMRHVHMIGSIFAWGGMALNMQTEDIFYISLPLFHSNAVHIGLASALNAGSTIALARRFSVKNFWKDIRKYNATCFNYIGELCRYLLNQPPTPQDREHSVYKICGNGLRPEIWKEFKERFNIRRVHEHYGATEIRGMFCNYFNLECTIGFNFDPYVIVKYNIDTEEPIQNNSGYLQAVEEGEAGLLLMKIKDDTTFAGYTNKEATKKMILHNPFGNDETWLITGDMLRNIGYYHAQFVDRLGDTFRWKGENVSTAEVEDVLSSFEQIEHSSVYGVKIPNTDGRAGMASIKATKDHEDFNFKGLFTLLHNHLPKYAIPKFLRFLSKLSTTSTFKIQKSNMKKEGFDISKTPDSIYILLPGNSEYKFMTEEIYKNVLNGEYRF